MTFTWPWALLALLVVPLLLALAWLLRRRRRRAAVRVTSIALVRAALPRRTRWVRLLPSLLLLLGLASLGVAAARPQARVPVASDSTTIMLAMDVSGSMCSTDVDPNRITVAQQAAIKFIEAEGGDTRIGLVAFAGRRRASRSRRPPTPTRWSRPSTPSPRPAARRSGRPSSPRSTASPRSTRRSRRAGWTPRRRSAPASRRT